jgi:CheY-like chemotaxis protein
VSAAKYRVTNHGRLAYETKDPAVPSDYRLLLWLIDLHGDRRREAWAESLPGQRIDDCLGELEDLGLVERVEPGAGRPPGPPARILPVRASELAGARTSLEEHGAYVNVERLKARKAKAAAQTVVLVVEDDPDQRALADLRISMAGYEVRSVESQSALVRSLARDGIPDLVLLDVMLPDGDGFEILARLRRLRSFAALPIVMLTVRKDPADIERGLMLGADGYVTKPYSRSILAGVLARVLGAPGG